MFDGDQLLRPKLESLKEDLPDMLKATNPVQKKRVRYNDIGDLVSKINRMHLDTYMLLQMLESLRELAEGIRETVDQAC